MGKTDKQDRNKLKDFLKNELCNGGYFALALLDHLGFEPGTFGVAAGSPNLCTAWSANDSYKIYKIKFTGTF